MVLAVSEIIAGGRSARWYVVGTLTGLRCEEHFFEPDNALCGPFRTGDIAAIAMQRMIELDRWEMLVGWIVIGGFSLTFAGWLIWSVVS